ncbi:MAG: mobile mystery protein A [Candidatus Marinimicrobia bacterium]|nr:mobile mystery protein A [Candidatus Neomarinimicrobiota bacterium]
MNTQKLILNQVDNNINILRKANNLVVPQLGWIYSIRKALSMSLRQLGKRMSITPQSMKEIEEREKRGTVSINVLKQTANALNMKFIYGFIPEHESLENMIQEKAYKIAKEIVLRTSINMKLEDQENSDIRIKNAIKEKTDEIVSKMPRYLWN